MSYVGIPYTIECANCEEYRIGFKREDEVVPLQDECQECDESEFNVLGHHK